MINEVRKGRTADTATAEDRYDALKKFARDLTEAARAGKLFHPDAARPGRGAHPAADRPARTRRCRSPAAAAGKCVVEIGGGDPADLCTRPARDPAAVQDALARTSADELHGADPARVAGHRRPDAKRGAVGGARHAVQPTRRSREAAAASAPSRSRGRPPRPSPAAARSPSTVRTPARVRWNMAGATAR